MFTKSGIMVGLGEERNEVLQVMDDLRSADVDFLTIGQYLQPTRKHHAVERFVTPDEFKSYETIAYAKGFLMVVGVAADALLASCRRGFRAPQGRARGEPISPAMPQFSDQAPRAAHRGRHVRSGRRRRALSAIRAALQRLKVRSRTREAEGVEVVIVADMTVAYKLDPRNLHQPRHARSAPICGSWSNISTVRSAAWRTAGRFSRWREGRMRRRILHRLRIQEPHARHADGRDVRHRVPPLRRGVREARRRRSTASSGSRVTPPVSSGRLRLRPRRRGRAACASACSTECWRTLPRPISPKRFSRIDQSGRRARRRQNAPGRPAFRPLPPPGPAMPVIETARSTRRMRERAARHRLGGLAADRAMPLQSRRAGTPSISCLACVRIGDEAAIEHVGRAGNFGQRAGHQAAGAGFRRRDRQPRCAWQSVRARPLRRPSHNVVVAAWLALARHGSRIVAVA